MLPNKLLIAVGLALGLIIGAYFYGYSAGGDSVRAAAAVEAQKAVKKARKEEQALQEKVNEQAQKQFDDLSDIASNLNADNLRLRDRANRRRVPKSGEASCEGSSGADLSGADARFLVREAARADTLRTALKSCYRYADTVSK